MSADSEVSFTRRELLDYLPAGWVLSDPDSGGLYNDKLKRWEVTLRDICDVEWELHVDDRAASADGRIEALRAAVDELDRAALGSPGFFG